MAAQLPDQSDYCIHINLGGQDKCCGQQTEIEEQEQKHHRCQEHQQQQQPRGNGLAEQSSTYGKQHRPPQLLQQHDRGEDRKCSMPSLQQSPDQRTQSMPSTT